MHVSIRLIILLAFSAMSAATARDVYVDNQRGNDSQNGAAPRSEGREVGPVRSLSKAFRTARAGDRIVVAQSSEPYREEVTIQGGNNSGIFNHVPLVLEGNGLILDGTLPIPIDEWRSLGGNLFRYDPPIRSSQTLWLGDEPAERVPFSLSAGQIKLEPKQWMLIDGGIVFRTEGDRLPYEYAPRCSGYRVGFTIYEASFVILRDVTIRGFALDGVNAHDGAMDVRLERVHSTHNGRSGFSIGGSSRVKLDQSTAAHNFLMQLRTEGHAIATIRECTFDNARNNAIFRDGGRVVEEKVDRTAEEPVEGK